jgi:hypothetical protein
MCVASVQYVCVFRSYKCVYSNFLKFHYSYKSFVQWTSGQRSSSCNDNSFYSDETHHFNFVCIVTAMSANSWGLPWQFYGPALKRLRVENAHNNTQFSNHLTAGAVRPKGLLGLSPTLFLEKKRRVDFRKAVCTLHL